MKSNLLRRLAGGLLALAGFGPAAAQSTGIGLEPGRIETEVRPGSDKTVTFEIESAPSERPSRLRLVLSPTDWKLSKTGALEFPEPGTSPLSASSWMRFSPTALTIASGQRMTVRVTLSVPSGTPPGTYRAGIFVQERPTATPPKPGERTITLRFRYFLAVYAVVPPAKANPAFTDVFLTPLADSMKIVLRMDNDGTRHARPWVSYTIRNAAGAVVEEVKDYEATVLLAGSALDQEFPLRQLPPGAYEISAKVDFHNKGPIQSLTRTVEVAPPAAPPSAAPAPASPQP